MMQRMSIDAVVGVCSAIYRSVQKYHPEKDKMDLDDPKLVSVCISFDVWAHAICELFFKGEQVLLFCSHMNWLLSFKVHLSINTHGCYNWLNPKSYNR